MSRPLWQPDPARIERSNLVRFLDHLREEGIVDLADVEALHAWSIREAPAFWRAVWDFTGVRGEPGASVVEGWPAMPGTRWFPEARLNFADNLLRRDDDHPALVARDESGRRRAMSYAELGREARAFAAALRARGVGVGDRVAGYMPNICETVVAMLGASWVGATWSSCSQDFGVQAAVDRLGQIGPRVLVAADGYRYSGKDLDVVERLAGIVDRIPTLETVVVVPNLDGATAPEGLPGQTTWEEFLLPDDPGAPADLPFDHPQYILYSSGTTGLPKCIVHGAGGTLLQHAKELVLHTDLTAADTIVYYTTCGWMMWNWLVSSLAVGATVVLVDGSPFGGGDDHLFALAEEEGVSVLGVSAKYLAECGKRGIHPGRDRDLSALRTILSTGSPLLPASYDWVYDEVKDDVCLSSISGGTDIVGCFALGNPIGPVHRGELQMRGLGMAVEVFSPDGKPMVGEPGELVCTRPFPSMPVGFWGDDNGKRYRAAYFRRFPGIWTHGDWVELTPRGSMVFHGRSDATLNPGGVRIGTAEIYRQVETLDAVRESVVVGQEWDGDVRVVLFVVLREGQTLDGALRKEIRDTIRGGASPHHVPRRILQVDDIPRTVSGKISELAVRDVVHGRPVDNRQALANPEALEQFRERPELVD